MGQKGYGVNPEPTKPLPDFSIKDSGKRENLAGGMVRDTEEGKTDYTLILDGPMLARWAVHLTKGAVKYAARNWMKSADGSFEERGKVMERYRRSAMRHFVQWMNGERDEDHGAAVFFNINGYEYLRDMTREELGMDKPEPHRPEDRATITHSHHGMDYHDHPIFTQSGDHEKAHLPRSGE